MKRTTDRDYPLLIDDSGNGRTLVDASDVDYPMSGGPEVDLWFPASGSVWNFGIFRWRTSELPTYG